MKRLAPQTDELERLGHSGAFRREVERLAGLAPIEHRARFLRIAEALADHRRDVAPDLLFDFLGELGGGVTDNPECGP